MSPDTATEYPKKSSAAASAAVSLPCSAQVTPERTNTYAEPAPPASPGAPTTAVSPETATEVPNWSFAAASEAVSLACWAQVTPERTNTYAEPVRAAALFAPTTAVSAETATEVPKKLPAAASEAVSLACWNQGSMATG